MRRRTKRRRIDRSSRLRRASAIPNIRHFPREKETLRDRCIRVNSFREAFLSIRYLSSCEYLDLETGLPEKSLGRQKAKKVMSRFDFRQSPDSAFWWDDITRHAFGTRRDILTEDFNRLSRKKLIQLYQTFCSPQLESGNDKADLVDSLVDLFVSEVTAVDRREEECRVLEDVEIVNLYFEFHLFHVGEEVVLTLPCDVVKSILSFLSYGKELLYSVGLVNWNWYCAVLSSWPSVRLEKTNVFEVPVTVLRAVKTVTIWQPPSADSIAKSWPLNRYDAVHVLESLQHCEELLVGVRQTVFWRLLSENEWRDRPSLQTIRHVSSLSAPNVRYYFWNWTSRSRSREGPTNSCRLPLSVISFRGPARILSIPEFDRFIDIEVTESAAFSALVNMPRLISLAVNAECLTKEGFEWLHRHLPQLRRLCFSDSRVTLFPWDVSPDDVDEIDLSAASNLVTLQMLATGLKIVGLSAADATNLQECTIDCFQSSMLTEGLVFDALQVVFLRANGDAPALQWLKTVFDLYETHLARRTGPFRKFFLSLCSNILVVLNGAVVLMTCQKVEEDSIEREFPSPLHTVFLSRFPLLERHSFGFVEELNFQSEDGSIIDQEWFPYEEDAYRKIEMGAERSLFCSGPAFANDHDAVRLADVHLSVNPFLDERQHVSLNKILAL